MCVAAIGSQVIRPSDASRGPSVFRGEWRRQGRAAAGWAALVAPALHTLGPLRLFVLWLRPGREAFAQNVLITHQFKTYCSYDFQDTVISLNS